MISESKMECIFDNESFVSQLLEQTYKSDIKIKSLKNIKKIIR